MKCFLSLISSFCILFSVSCQTFTPIEGYEERLQLLETRVNKDLELLNFPKLPWLKVHTTQHGAHIYDVAIIGGGQNGATIAFALRREQVTNVIVFDENKKGFEGPWRTFAHMPHLQTSKQLTGPDCGIPSLTCQAWFEAKYGEEVWNQLEHIPTCDWADYLSWFKEVLNLPICNQTKVGALKWDEKEQCFIVPLYRGELEDQVYARKIVFATGISGSGSWLIPSSVEENLSKTLYSSVYENVDFAQLKGKKVAIFGGGASAFDAALLCHANEVKEVHLFLRRPRIVDGTLFPSLGFAGFLGHFSDLPDSDKWKYVAKIVEIGQFPAHDALVKVQTTPNIVMHFNCIQLKTEHQHDHVLVTTPEEQATFDYLLIATGSTVDLHCRNELREFCDGIALWSDRFVAADCLEHASLMRMPYLGKYFEFLEKNPGTMPYLQSIFNCTGAAFLSTGFNTGVMGMKYGIPKLVYGIVGQLFLEDKEYYYHTAFHHDDPH